MEKRSVGIFIFEQVEVLDFAGPYEVFSRTRLVPGIDSRRSSEHAPFHVFTVARTRDPIHATGGLQVIPDHSFADCPRIDLLVVAGGFGTRPLMEDAEVGEWIRRVSAGASVTASVCTGALLLARAGLLRGRRATTHWGALDLLASLDDSIRVERGTPFVDDAIVTSAGVAAGIEMAFHVVERLHGKAVADETARYIEYPRTGRP